VVAIHKTSAASSCSVWCLAALLVVLDTLAPAERLAFVLHDMFAVPFDEIGSILGRSPNAAKQLASRARRRVQAADAAPGADLARQTELVRAFLAASRSGDFAALLGVLHPGVVLRADPTAIKVGAQPEVRGAPAVAEQFAGRAFAAVPAVIAGAPGAVWDVTRGIPRAAFRFTISHGMITEIDIIFDPRHLRRLEIVILGS